MVSPASAAKPSTPPQGSASARYIRGLRALTRSSELALVAAAALVGLVAALCVTAMTQTAIFMHKLIFDLPFDVRLSAADRVSPWAAFGALSLGGLSLGLMESWRRKREIPGPVDPIEANALRGGRMSLRDSFVVAMQTLISNSCGASVGLEAGYAQIGSGLGSYFGQKLGVRRSDLRLLVGAGAAAAIGGSFGAPLTGAFYAFEIILGAYSIAGAGPIFAASIVGVLTTHILAGAPYQISTPPIEPLTLGGYPALLGLAACAAALGIAAMRAAGLSEKALEATKLPVWARPVIGGFFVAALAVVTPQVLGAGHGALALVIATNFSLMALAAFLSLKMVACMVSLASGFRGGLFFASLFMGALLGKIYAMVLFAVLPAAVPDPTICVLAGMATLGVVIVGGPLTMSFLVLENTADFSVTAGVLAASVAASLMARRAFGYSFSTWRLHLRGENIRSANDIGWVSDLTVGRLMQPDPPTVDASIELRELCALYPLGSARAIVVTDEAGRYAGLVNLAEAHVHAQNGGGKAGELARFSDSALHAAMNAKVAMAIFDKSQSDQLAVVDPLSEAPIGILSEPYLARRYAEKADAAARSALGM
ncbi:chloride channel protein [Rhodoblastus sp.]|uniref:chloride channel protein n=1 Tax=Rhodoblastus sp. TaxID=1962975 RepID=UPI003F96551A